MSSGSRSVDDPAVDAGHFLCRLALIILMIIVPCAEVASRLAIYSLLPVGAVVLIIGGLLIGVVPTPRRLNRIFTSPLALAALVLTLWTGLSLVWTPFPEEAGTRFVKAFGTEVVVFLAIFFLPERTRPANLYLLPIGLALAAVAILALRPFDPAAFRNGFHPDATLAQRCAMSMVMLVFPAMGALSLRERWRLAAALAALVVAAVLASFVEVALAAFAIGAVVHAIAFTKPAQTAKICGYTISGLILFAPVLALVLSPLAALVPQAHFAEPLRISAHLVVHEWPRLITGHGLDMAARATEIGYLPAETPRSLLFLVWYDLGLVGAACFAYLNLGLFLLIGRLSAVYAPPVLGGLAAGWVIALCGAETTQVWWITLNGLTAVAFAIFIKAHMRRKRLTAAAVDEAATRQATSSVRSAG